MGATMLMALTLVTIFTSANPRARGYDFFPPFFLSSLSPKTRNYYSHSLEMYIIHIYLNT